MQSCIVEIKGIIFYEIVVLVINEIVILFGFVFRIGDKRGEKRVRSIHKYPKIMPKMKEVNLSKSGKIAGFG